MKSDWRNGRVVRVASCLLGVMLAGCGGSDEDLKPRPTIVVDGSSTVYRISLAAQEAFHGVDPNITVVVDNHGTGGGFGRYLEGEVDIVDASRPAKPDEESKAKAQGINWSRMIVGYDGITLVVNPKNTFVKSLTVDQLKAIWQPDSKVKTWKDIDPSWPDRKIILYSPDHDSGTFEFFTEAIVGKARSQRDDVQTSSDDNILVSGIAGDPDGLGYMGYAYYAENSKELRAIPVQNGASAKPVMPGPETIADKSYTPLSRPLFIYVKNSSARRPEVANFLKYYVENLDALTKKAGYDPPTAADMTSNREVLATLVKAGATGDTAAEKPATATNPTAK
jgi:phosphate transport system substrate-binding protein